MNAPERTPLSERMRDRHHKDCSWLRWYYLTGRLDPHDGGWTKPDVCDCGQFLLRDDFAALEQELGEYEQGMGVLIDDFTAQSAEVERLRAAIRDAIIEIDEANDYVSGTDIARDTLTRALTKPERGPPEGECRVCWWKGSQCDRCRALTKPEVER